MTDFDETRLRRAPDVEAPNLQAYDATDRLLADRVLALAADGELRGEDIVVIGDDYGAITLRLIAAGLTGIRVHQDLITGRRALDNNASALGLAGYIPRELDDPLLTGARVVLLQLPKTLAELEEIADAVTRWAADDVRLVAGGRVKHMTLTQNEVLGRRFAHVQAERAAQKSRLVVASDPLPAPAERPFPVRSTHPEFGLTLCAHGGAFAADRIDIGTRVLLEAMDAIGDAADVIDLGCGSGALAASYALRHPAARVVATDRSAAAVASVVATMSANGLADRVRVTHDDVGSDLPDAGADIVLLNPPFHLGASVHTGAATRMFEAAARLLRPGGELWTVFNSSLGYRPQLTTLVGATEQVRRTPKFTVTRSVRRE